MPADQDTFAAVNGVGQNPDGTPNNVPDPWRWVRVRGRQIRGALAKLGPFAWPNTSQPESVSMFDAVTGTAEQVASRFVDPVGNVVNFFTVWVVQWLWFLDGAPTPLANAKLAEYLQLANQINPWPTGYPGCSPTTFPDEAFATYPAWPPAGGGGNTVLSNFLPSATNPQGTNAAGEIG
jgi:hypothetical protein